MRIKVIYREITNCRECPFCFSLSTGGAVCSNKERRASVVPESLIPPDCPLPDMRLDTEDDSTE
jgi:hypothetical protein